MKRTYILLAVLAGLSVLGVIGFRVTLAHHVGAVARRIADKMDPEPCGNNLSYNADLVMQQHQRVFSGWVRGNPLTLEPRRAAGLDSSLRSAELAMRYCIRH